MGRYGNTIDIVNYIKGHSDHDHLGIGPDGKPFAKLRVSFRLLRKDD